MKTNAVSVTVYDMSGAPLHPAVLSELERVAERIAKEHKLVINVARG